MTPKARIILVGVIVPLLIAAAGVAAVLIALPQLPDPVAVHWDLSGRADGFASPVIALVVPAVTVLAYSVVAFVVGRAGRIVSAGQRLILAMGPFLALFITVLVAGSTVAQAGLTDPRAAGSVLPLLLVALVLAAGAGIGAWFVLPPSDPGEPTVVVPRTLPLGQGERASWIQRSEAAPRVIVPVAAILVLAIVGGGAALAAVAPPAAWIVFVVGLLVIGALAVGSLSWRVSVDGAGLRVRSIAGFPRFSIPLSDVETASAVEIEPLRDFAGWGIRFGGGRRLGLITRGGEALEVRRHNGSALVVTVSDAATGAALLTTLSQRVH